MDDGPPIVRTARSVVVGNSGLLPGGFALLPDASLDDGLLDVAILAPQGPFGWPRLATRVLTNSHVQDRQLERLQARTVEITNPARSMRAPPLQLDKADIKQISHRFSIADECESARDFALDLQQTSCSVG